MHRKYSGQSSRNNSSSLQNGKKNSALSLQSDTKSMIDFVFYQHPRIFSFSHRSLISLRHPALRMFLLDENFQNSRKSLPNRLKSRSSDRNRKHVCNKEILQKFGLKLAKNALSLAPPDIQRAIYILEVMFTSLSESGRESSTFLWERVAHAHDLIIEEHEIASRRKSILNSSLVLNQVEVWWSFFCTTNCARFVSYETYRSLQRCLFYILIGIPIPTKSDESEVYDYYHHLIDWILTKITENDYVVDHVASSTPLNEHPIHKENGVDFANFFYSLLELVDTWSSVVEADAFALYLKSLFQKVTLWFEPPITKTTLKVVGADSNQPEKIVEHRVNDDEQLRAAYKKALTCSLATIPCNRTQKIPFLVICKKDPLSKKHIFFKHFPETDKNTLLY